MYAISSMASIIGPMIMAFSGGHAASLISGAIIACFGISNFFSQMYEYMIGLHPKYQREIALLINYTMPLGAIGAALLRLASGVPGLDMGLAGLALAGSVALTPGMLANTSIVRMFQQKWNNSSTVQKVQRKWGNAKRAANNYYHDTVRPMAADAAISVSLAPGMLANSGIVRTFKRKWNDFKGKPNNYSHGENVPPAEGGNPAPAEGV